MNTIGQHILIEFHHCATPILNDGAELETVVMQAVQEAGETAIGSLFRPVSPSGISGVVLLRQSHLAIHTQPEANSVAVDLLTDGQTFNPQIAYEVLKTAFQAETGDLRNLASPPRTTPPLSRNVWLTDSNKNVALSIRHTGELLFQEQSPYQKVEIYDTFEYGKMLTVDSMVMCTEEDEYAYHEMIIHVPVLAHGGIKTALIIGGGDGGSVRELVRHPDLEQVTMVEIDEVVIQASRQYLPTLSRAFNHPKLNLIIGDGIEFIQNAADQSFDLIVIDSSDPVGPAKGLFNPDFYHQVYRCLRSGGVMTVQSESPSFNQAACVELHQCLRQIFGADQVHCYLIFIPTYPTGMWSFNYCTKQGPHPVKDLNREQAEQFAQAHGLKYYNAAVHQAAFCLPTFVQNMLNGQ